MVAVRRRRQLVQERLHGEGDAVGARRAPGSAGGGERQHRLAEPDVLRQQGGKLVLVDVASGNRVLAVGAERDEVILPSGELAGGVDGALERVEAADPVEVVLHVVFARPLQLHRRADVLGDERGLAHGVVDQAPAEAAAGAHLVDGHAARGDAEQAGEHRQRSIGGLRRRPDFDLAVSEGRGACSAAPSARARRTGSRRMPPPSSRPSGTRDRRRLAGSRWRRALGSRLRPRAPRSASSCPSTPWIRPSARGASAAR